VTLADSLLVVAAGALVVLAGTLVMSEAALSRVSRVRVEELLREGRRGAGRLQAVLADPVRYFNILLLVRVAFELTATVLVSVVCFRELDFGWGSVLLVAGAMTVVSYVLVGVAPRTLGIQHADAVALRTVGVAVLLNRVLGPLPRLLILLGNALTPGRGFRDGPFNTEAELRDLVDLAEERHLIEHGEREMIHSVFKLGDTIAREVMVPRTDIVFIERGKTIRQALSLCLRSGFSRIPVIGESEDDIVGIVYLKDLVRRSYDARENDTVAKVESIAREAMYVPDSKPVDELLREMQLRQTHIAIAVDEYGGTAGLVTIEDILEEIVGEITDEYDREAPRVERIDDETVRVTVRLPVDDLNEMFGVELPAEDIETVGGLLASLLGRVPIPGATASVQGLTFTAEGTAGRRNRIGTVLVRREPASVDDADVPAHETEPADARS
jgi:CBS domain containing-hemolysin-like protein